MNPRMMDPWMMLASALRGLLLHQSPGSRGGRCRALGAGLLAAVAVGGGCTMAPAPAASPAPKGGQAQELRRADENDGGIEAAPGNGSAGGTERTSRLFVEQFEGGASAGQIERLLAPAGRRVRECVPGSNGVVRVRLVRRAEGLAAELSAGQTFEPGARACLNDVLSRLDVDDALNKGSPSERTSGFTALLRFEW
jgi:hypothetical protein